MTQDGRIAGEFLDFTTRDLDLAALRSAATDEVFLREALRCFSDLGRPLRAVASIRRFTSGGQLRGMTRDEAIVAGHTVRLSKLHAFMVEPAVASSAERFFLLLRPLIETSANAIYLCKLGEPAIFDEFVRYSMRFDKKMLERAQRDVDEGDDAELQRRMVRNIPDAFIRADVDPTEVDADSRKDWSGQGGVYGRFRAIGWSDLYSLFQAASHYTHGNWHDLSVHHIGQLPATPGYQPALHLSPLQPQPVATATRVLAEAAHVYLEHAVLDSEERSIVEVQLRHQAVQAQRLDELHERWIGGRH